ncbi:MAG: LysR family transcriptional regulator [Nitrospirae bacterium]|nr:MAG: LysR family transcriptional regulator [Nitrospirota bacterium]
MIDKSNNKNLYKLNLLSKRAIYLAGIIFVSFICILVKYLLMNFHQLNTFLKVYSYRSFTRAAEELGLSQPTISEQIKNLESELGFKLFDRLGRTVVPTQEAELLYPRAQEILDEVRNLKNYITEETRRVEGLIKVGASTIPGTYLLPAYAAGFRQLYPEVSFEISVADSEDITERVKSHELLMGFTGAIMDSEKVEAVPFYQDRLIVVGSERLVKKNRLGVEELLKLPFLLRERGSGTRKTMENFFASRGIGVGDLNVIAVLGSTDAVKQALKASLGISIISDIAVKEELKSGKLKEVKVRGFNIKRDFYIITLKHRTLPLQYRRFYDFVIKDAKGLVNLDGP